MTGPDDFLESPIGEHLADFVRAALSGSEGDRADGDAGEGGDQEDGVEGDEPPASRFGPYRVTHEIGRGGMGTVYEAERADRRYDRKVAIKTVTAAVPGGLLARRFETEGRILAGLEHPNIARLYDAGATPDGVPYVVMEHVDGRRIDSYCDEEELSVDERLDLFDRVCEAVEYAHAKLIVHRDIKPGNILVTDDGVPKLLDFGIARLLDPVPGAEGPPEAWTGAGGPDAIDDQGPVDGEGAAASDSRPPAAESTMTLLRALTPEYASPEQLRGEPVTTAADVYALGVLLYLLLSGQHPYQPAERTPAELERLIREKPARPPSEVLEAGSRSRRARLRGDLDDIVLRAIRPDAAARYASVGHLRADVRNHRADLPIAAHAATWRYRARKFARRHRVGLAATALVFLSLAGGLAGTAWQARVAAEHAERAERTRDYLISLFETFDPDDAGGDPVTAEELLDRGADRLERDLADEPTTRAELGGVLGQLYQRLGLFDDARPLLESARATLLDAYGEEHPETAAAMARLASLLFDEGEYEEAEGLARTALENRRRLFGSSDTLVANSLNDLAAIRSRLGHWEEALELHGEALAIDRRGGTPEQVATDLSNLGVVHIRLGRLDEARRLLEESLAIRRAEYGDRHTAVATSLLNLAEALRAGGDYDEAEALLRECIEMRRELLGDRHPHLALALHNLGSVLQEAGRLDEAEQAFREGLEIRRAVFGDAHPEAAASLNSLGVVAYFQGDHTGAADRFAEVVPIWREQLGEDHPHVLTVMNNLGAARREAGEFETAELVLRQVLDIRQRVLGDEHPDIGQSLNNLAFVLYRRGALDEAERTFRDAIASWRGSLGDDHPTLAAGLVGLGQLLRDTDRCAEAEVPLREAVTLREASLDPESSLLASARAHFGLCLADLGRGEASDSLLDAALPVLEENWGPDDDLVRQVRAARARRS